MKRRAAFWLAAIWLCLVPLASQALAAAQPPPRRNPGSDTRSAPTGNCSTGIRSSPISTRWRLQATKYRVTEYGRSAENRPLIVATIAAPETLRNLDRYREIQRRLADPRITTPAQAEPLFKEGKNVVLLTCSIHADEVASTHSAVEFAYRLITENNPHFQSILSNTILLLVPSLNPDGVDIVTRWYRSTLGTHFEGTDPPELYQKYVGHDNNRDWYIFSQPETRATISQLHNVWHPEIVYDVHQQGAYASRMFIPPWLDPTEPNIDPIISQEMNALGTSMASDLTAAGKRES